MSKIKLDDIDHQILDMLIENTRTPFTDIAKKLLISAGTVHVRVKKMEDYGLIKGSLISLKRILSCHPVKFLGGGDGFDPVKKNIRIKK